MNTNRTSLALLILLTIPLSFAAIDSTPTAQSSAGGNPAVAVNGDDIAILHRKVDSGVNILTISTNGGASFNDKATGENNEDLHWEVVAAGDGQSFGYVRPHVSGTQCNSGTTGHLFQYTLDGGDSWGNGELPGFASIQDTCTPNHPTGFDLDVEGTVILVGFENFCLSTGGGCDGTNSGAFVGVAKSTDAGQSWDIEYSQKVCGSGLTSAGPTNPCDEKIYDVAVDNRGASGFSLWWRDVDVGVKRYDSATGITATINDPFSPLSDYGYGLTVAHTDGAQIAFHDGNETGDVWMGFQQPGNNGNTFYFRKVADSPVNITKPEAFFTDDGAGVLTITDGDSVALHLYEGDLDGFSDTTVGTGTPLQAQAGVYGRCNHLLVAYRDPATSNLALYSRGFNEELSCPAAFGPSASVDVSGLVGFDVDVTGQNVLIARHDGGLNVSTYAPGTLADYATDATGCSAVPSVDALPTHVAYTACDPADDVDQIRIRSPVLGTPAFNGCTWCRGTVDEEDDAPFANNIDLPNNWYSLKSISQYPYTFEYQQPNGPFSTITTVAFPFVEFDTGQFGIYAVNFVDNDLDQDATKRVSFAGSGRTVEDMCSWRDPVTDQDFIAVTEHNVGLKVFSFSITNDGLARPVITIDQYQTAPSFLSQADSIGCWGNLILASTFDGKAGAYWLQADPSTGVVAGQTAWGPVSISSILHGVSRQLGYDPSTKTYYGAITDGDQVTVINAGTGEGLLNITLPGTELKGIDMDRNANNLWLGVDTTLSRYFIAPFTTGTETLDNNPCPFCVEGNTINPPGGSSTTGSGLGAQAAGAADAIWGNGGASIMGYVLILALGAAGFVKFKSSTLGVIFAGAGIAIAKGVGLLTGGDVFLLLVILAIALGVLSVVRR